MKKRSSDIKINFHALWQIAVLPRNGLIYMSNVLYKVKYSIKLYSNVRPLEHAFRR